MASKPSRLSPIGRVKRRLLHLVRPSTYWSLVSWSERRAYWTTIKVRRPELFDQRSRELAERLRPYTVKESRLLDIGCGIGRPQRYLAPHVGHVYGVDISRRMLSIARKRHGDLDNVSWHRINGTDLAFASSNSIDFAYSELVFQHVDKLKVVSLWTDLVRVLNPGGLALLQLLNLESPYNRRAYVRSAFDSTPSPGDVRFWTVSEVQAVASEIGLRVEHIQTESDFRGPDGDPVMDELHADYSIWLLARKPGEGAILASGVPPFSSPSS